MINAGGGLEAGEGGRQREEDSWIGFARNCCGYVCSMLQARR